MMSKKIVTLCAVLIASVCFVLSCPSLGVAQTVTVSIENGSVGYGLGVRGSTFSFACSAGSNPGVACDDDVDCSGGTCEPLGNPNYPESNRVEISLQNNVDIVSFSANFCTDDLGSELIYRGYKVSSRGEAFPYTIVENGTCIDMTFPETPPLKITQGTGTLVTLYFDVATFAVDGNCADLNLNTVVERDGIPGFIFPSDTGQFCYYNCAVDQHCDDGIFCNGGEFCAGGLCTTFARNPCNPLLCDDENDLCYCDNDLQCDDYLYCNGTETCNTGTGNCETDPPPPCQNDGDTCTDDCDENGDTCLLQVCNAEGPWDYCCLASPACSPLPICNEEVTLTVGTGSGAASSTGREVEVSLANPNDAVKSLQLTVCDVDNYVVVPESQFCALTPRVPSGNACTCNETANGCATCFVYPAPFENPDPISPGTGPVLKIKYDVGPIGEVANGQCRDLVVDTEESLNVLDSGDNPLVVMPENGEFCVTCGSNEGCNDGNPCTDYQCVGGLCEYTNLSGSCDDFMNDCTVNGTCEKADPEDEGVMMCGSQKCNVCVLHDPCGDDGGYCNGVEYCVGGLCWHTELTDEFPCELPLTCEEVTDVCEFSDVTLRVEDTSDRVGVIAIALDNDSDQVSEVHLNVCNVDQRDWLHISTDECTVTSRASNFTCSFNGRCAVEGDPCSPATQETDCTMQCGGAGGAPCDSDWDCKECSISHDPCLNDDECPTGEGTCVGPICDACTNFDLGNGCVGVDLTSPLPLDLIETGSGPIIELSYTVDPVTIAPGDVADIEPQNFSVLDDGASSLTVTPQSGKLELTDYCEGNFDEDNDVDALDVSSFLIDFGRGVYNQPCSVCIIGSGLPPNNFCWTDADCGVGGECGAADPACNGDFECDGDVDAVDVGIFLEDFGRGTYFNPCPTPPVGWFDCAY